jgi:hypothetical protein
MAAIVTLIYVDSPVAQLTNKTCFHQPGFDLCLVSWIKLLAQLCLHSPNEDSLALQITPHLNVPVLIISRLLVHLPVLIISFLLTIRGCCRFNLLCNIPDKST